MRAIIYRSYGSPEVLELRDVDMPVVQQDGVLVRVHAASINPRDWHFMTGTPYMVRIAAGLLKPKDTTLGVDFAGRVEAVGTNVTQFQPGDEVFGMCSGALAEYVRVAENRVVMKPPNVSFDEAAAVPIAALTALQSLRDKGHLQPGHKVLINGASGGVGTFAVQIAKSLGADVTGVCSTRNVEIVRSIGADSVIDYTQQNFTKTGQSYDVILDVAGSRPLSDCRRMLNPKGTLIIVGGPKKNRLVGPLTRTLRARLLSLAGRRKMVSMLARANREDLVALQELLAAGKVTAVIDKRYPLSEVPDAFRYLGTGHAKGKIVISV